MGLALSGAIFAHGFLFLNIVQNAHPMERTTFTRIPDAINCSQTGNFTQVPNDLLRNPNISGKAKALLCLLLSNKQGWTSYVETLKTMMKEGKNAINAGLNELVDHGYLFRVRYRCKETKKWEGSVWAYTDTPHQFELNAVITQLSAKDMELDPRFLQNKPQPCFPHLENPHLENGPLIIPSNKKTNSNNTFSDDLENSGNSTKIKTSQFEDFWKMYPKKVDKGKCLSIWKRICSRKKDVPDWDEIKNALNAQIKTKRWADPKFIPNPSTWLNQSRWMDDPLQMNPIHKKSTTPTGFRASLPPKYRRDGVL